MDEHLGKRLYHLVAQIPAGQVATYGQLAAMLGSPRAARIVGHLLSQCRDDKLPCFRVVRHDGSLAPGFAPEAPGIQKILLQGEHVPFLPDDRVDLASCQWNQPHRPIIFLPDPVAYILRLLREAGYHAYAVGGCVRDSLMGRIPHDWDICTSAQPQQMQQVFQGLHVVKTGIKHGTLTVMLNAVGYEVTTFRIDGDYTDGRHPDRVSFTDDITRDLSRRDFTINAMAFNGLDDCVMDPFGGQQDIRHKIIRCVGDPYARFCEDALRILRAIRFSARLGFAIEQGTQCAMQRCAPLLHRISMERIREELFGIIDAPFGPTCLMDNRQIIGEILPQWARLYDTPQNTPYHYGNVMIHTIDAMKQAAHEPFIVKLALFLHDIGKPDSRTTDEAGRDHFKGHQEASASIARTLLRRLKCDNATLAQAVKLVGNHDLSLTPTRVGALQLLHHLGERDLRLLLRVKRADALAHRIYEDRMAQLAAFEEVLAQVLSQRCCYSLEQLAVTGSDLIRAGFNPGPVLGQMLNRLLMAVINEQIDNEKDALIQWAKAHPCT